MMTRRPADWTDTAPVQARSIREMAATPDEVWAVLCDHAGWPAWFPRLQAARPTGGEGLGSTRTVRVANADVHEEFIVWDEPTSWGFTVVEAEGPLGAAADSLNERVDIVDLGSGRVRVTYLMAFQPKWWSGPIVRLVAKGLSANLGAALAGLEGEIERRR